MTTQGLFFTSLCVVLAIQVAACAEKPDCPEFILTSLAQRTGTPGAVFAVQMSPQKISITGPIAYAWSISAGRIAAGQGTPSILVTGPKGELTVASVAIQGFPRQCRNTVSATATLP
jgi:hypothetical protein